MHVTADTLPSRPIPHTAPGDRDPAHPPFPPSASDRDRLALAARRILQVNALTGIVSGPVLALGAGFVAPLVGLKQYAAVPVVQATGVGLVLFAALLLWITRRPVPPAAMLAIGVIDALWVAASAVLLVSGFLPLSAAGVWMVVIQADAIALLAALELRTWWRMRS
jgi:hypothetical protein